MLALESDSKQPLFLEAERVEVNEKTGISKYIGKVRLVQGTLVMTGDVATVHLSNNNELEMVLVVGNPAHFQQQTENKQQPVNAQANRMEYVTDKEHLDLLGNAVVKQGTQRFSGHHIVYNMRLSTVNAASDKSKSKPSRVKTIFVPGSTGELPVTPTITEPKNGHVTYRDVLTVKGTAQPQVSILLYNDAIQIGDPIFVDKEGNFSIQLVLKKGENRITLAAKKSDAISAISEEVLVIQDASILDTLNTLRSSSSPNSPKAPGLSNDSSQGSGSTDIPEAMKFLQETLETLDPSMLEKLNTSETSNPSESSNKFVLPSTESP